MLLSIDDVLMLLLRDPESRYASGRVGSVDTSITRANEWWASMMAKLGNAGDSCSGLATALGHLTRKMVAEGNLPDEL